MKQTLLEIPYMPPERAFAAFAQLPGSLFFDSSDPLKKLSRYSFICFEPSEIFISIDDLPHYAPAAGQAPLPFTGGLAGFISYDAPDARLGLYDQVIGFDHHLKKAWYCSFSDTQYDAQMRWNSLAKRIESAQPPDVNATRLSWSPVKSREAYTADIQRVIDYIYAGDIFQANLAQRFEADISRGFDPWAHYMRLRAVNPAPFSAYLNFGDTVISSSSPERFLFVRGHDVETRPIKGTHKDAAFLAASEKDRAENIMIVDLLRNDLSKVCEDTSIDVPQLCGVESYAGLHHLVSAVTGKLGAGKTALDTLLACFPGGSITGAPKIRAMEIIAELEPFRRGPYCGAIGYIGFDGAMDMNIAIRTLVYKDGKAIYHAGGGITAASDPAAEYDETLLKAQKIFESFA